MTQPFILFPPKEVVRGVLKLPREFALGGSCLRLDQIRELRNVAPVNEGD